MGKSNIGVESIVYLWTTYQFAMHNIDFLFRIVLNSFKLQIQNQGVFEIEKNLRAPPFLTNC